MDKKLNILVIEDSQADAELNVRLLRSAGYEVTYQRVESAPEMIEALNGETWDLILSDYLMPNFTVQAALEIYHKGGLNVPFIVISGAIGEVKAVQLIKAGAHDYLLKSNMARFIPVVERELREMNNQRAIINISNALSSSEEKFRSYIDNAPDGVFVADETGKYIEVNDAACRITGYSKEELLTMQISDLLPDESHEIGITQFSHVVNTGTSKADLLFKHKSGMLRWWTVEAVKLDETRFLSFTKDITDRKNANLEVMKAREELQHLNQYLMDARENERATVAMEIHDELGQALTAIKIDLKWVQEHLEDIDKSSQKLSRIIEMTNDTIKKVQRISAELRPELLDDLGLATAIEWYSDEFEKRTGMKCVLSLEDVPDEGERINLALFRIFQEALTNIIRHANATTVYITLRPLPDGITLIIEDDGVGISQKSISSGKSLGLIGMRERARQISGTVEFSKSSAAGTKIVTFIPTPIKDPDRI
ncbi:MAG: PAS domain S-box protein [Bacteroidetes bacterium]|nr:PAS domain S-box protein [Bacteroidota bacterium]